MSPVRSISEAMQSMTMVEYCEMNLKPDSQAVEEMVRMLKLKLNM